MKVIEIILVVAYLCVYLWLMPRMLRRQDVKTLKYITVNFVLQNLICIMSSDLLGNGSFVQLIILYKEVIFYGTIVLCLVRKKGKIQKSFLPLIFAVLVWCIYLFKGSANLYTKLICLRQLLTPICLIWYGRCFALSKDEVKDYLRFVLNLGIFQSIFGFVERFVLGDSFWVALNINQYMSNKGFDAWVFGQNLPGNFYSADLYRYIGMQRRLCGIIADPLLTGHFIAFCIVFLLFVNIYNSKKKKYCALAVMSIAVLLTWGKGAILIIAIAFLYKIWKQNKIVAILISILPIALVIFVIQNDVLHTLDSHTEGIASALSAQSIIGGGLGNAGNYANIYGAADSSIGESFVGALLAQTGLIGLIVFFYVMYDGEKRVLVCRDKLNYAVAAFILGTVMESIFSESAINFCGSGIGFIAFGILQASKNCGYNKVNSTIDDVSLSRKFSERNSFV